jgi:hypothetical protein
LTQQTNFFGEFMSAKSAKELVQKEHLEFVDVKFVDLFGQWQHLTLPTNMFDFNDKDTVPFDGSSIRGFKEINESDMVLNLDYSTAISDPFSSKTLSVVCDVYDPHQKKAYDRDPRGIAKKAEEYLKTTGFGDTIYFGPEAEFFVFDHLSFGQSENMGFYEIDSHEGIWNSDSNDGQNLAYRPRFKEGYFPVAPHDSLQELRNEMVSTMMKCGIKIERHHHEVATAVYGFSEEVAAKISDRIKVEVCDTGGIGGTLAANALSLAAMRATLENVLTEEAFAKMIPMAERFTEGVSAVIQEFRLPWHVSQLGSRAEYLFHQNIPKNGGEAAASADFELERYMHLHALNRGVLLTPFHNMALMSPVTSAEDVDKHTEVFRLAVKDLCD